MIRTEIRNNKKYWQAQALQKTCKPAANSELALISLLSWLLLSLISFLFSFLLFLISFLSPGLRPPASGLRPPASGLGPWTSCLRLGPWGLQLPASALWPLASRQRPPACGHNQIIETCMTKHRLSFIYCVLILLLISPNRISDHALYVPRMCLILLHTFLWELVVLPVTANSCNTWLLSWTVPCYLKSCSSRTMQHHRTKGCAVWAQTGALLLCPVYARITIWGVGKLSRQLQNQHATLQTLRKLVHLLLCRLMETNGQAWELHSLANIPWNFRKTSRKLLTKVKPRRAPGPHRPRPIPKAYLWGPRPHLQIYNFLNVFLKGNSLC